MLPTGSSEPMFIFHGTNVYRDGENVVIYASKLPDSFRQYDGLDGPSLLTKWTISTGGAALTTSEEQLHDFPLDLPSYDRRFLTTQQTDDGNIWFEGIIGYNFASGPVASIELPQRVPFGFHPAFHR